MTNNDELAMRLKAAAEKAVDNFDPNMFILTRDMVALLDERDADKKRIAELQEHFSSLDEGVNMLLAQYDQLASAIGWTTEKALAGEGNQEQYAEAMVKRIADLNGTIERECEKSRRMASRIAELEARTVSVKLPEPFTKSMYGTALYEHDDIVTMLAAAGIKLEVGE